VKQFAGPLVEAGSWKRPVGSQVRLAAQSVSDVSIAAILTVLVYNNMTINMKDDAVVYDGVVVHAVSYCHRLGNSDDDEATVSSQSYTISDCLRTPNVNLLLYSALL
jgi:hypothetical protein